MEESIFDDVEIISAASGEADCGMQDLEEQPPSHFCMVQPRVLPVLTEAAQQLAQMIAEGKPIPLTELAYVTSYDCDAIRLIPEDLSSSGCDAVASSWNLLDDLFAAAPTAQLALIARYLRDFRPVPNDLLYDLPAEYRESVMRYHQQGVARLAQDERGRQGLMFATRVMPGTTCIAGVGDGADEEAVPSAMAPHDLVDFFRRTLVDEVSNG